MRLLTWKNTLRERIWVEDFIRLKEEKLFIEAVRRISIFTRDVMDNEIQKQEEQG